MVKNELEALNKILVNFLGIKKLLRRKDIHQNVKDVRSAEFQRLIDDFNISQTEWSIIPELKNGYLVIREKVCC
jgi:hypothetical protein